MPVERRLRHAQCGELLHVLHLNQLLLLLDALPDDHFVDNLLQLDVGVVVFLLLVALLAHNRSDAIEAARQPRFLAHFLHANWRISVIVGCYGGGEVGGWVETNYKDSKHYDTSSKHT